MSETVKQRFSKKREAIYTCLCSTDSHPTADWIYHQLLPSYPDLSLATVYRNLSQMKDAGLIQSVGVVAGQERFDATVQSHTHFVCTQCNAVLDLHEIALEPHLWHRPRQPLAAKSPARRCGLRDCVPTVGRRYPENRGNFP